MNGSFFGSFDLHTRNETIDVFDRFLELVDEKVDVDTAARKAGFDLADPKVQFFLARRKAKMKSSAS